MKVNGNWLQSIATNIFNKEDVKDVNFWHVCGSISEITSEPIVLYTPPAGSRFYVTDVIVSVDDDNLVRFREGTNGCKSIFVIDVNTLGNDGRNYSHSFTTPYKSDVDGQLRLLTSTDKEVNYTVQGYYK